MKGLKTGGRKVGSVNKTTTELRGIFQAFLENNLDSLQSDFDLLEPKDRLNWIEKVAKMILPPPFSIDRLTDEQLDQVIEHLKNSYHG